MFSTTIGCKQFLVIEKWAPLMLGRELHQTIEHSGRQNLLLFIEVQLVLVDRCHFFKKRDIVVDFRRIERSLPKSKRLFGIWDVGGAVLLYL